MALRSFKYKKSSYQSMDSFSDSSSSESDNLLDLSSPSGSQKRQPNTRLKNLTRSSKSLSSDIKTHNINQPSDFDKLTGSRVSTVRGKVWTSKNPFAPKHLKPNKGQKPPYERVGTSDDSSDSNSTISASSLDYHEPRATCEPLIQSFTKPFLHCFSWVVSCLPSQRRNLDEIEAEMRRKRRRSRKIEIFKAEDKSMRERSKASPGFEGFCCPQNDSFYNSRPYSALQNHQFRLLKILSCESNGTISLEMVQNVDIARMHGRYSAISYFAGDPSDTITVQVDGHDFNAFATLASGITNIYRFWTKQRRGQDLLLWADQICINQGNNHEKTSQVALMRDIYQRAEMTFVSLCNVQGDGPSLTRFSQLDTETRIAHHDSHEQSATKVSTCHAPSSRSLLESFKNSVSHGADMDGWNDVYDIMAHPWWKRAWVFQEFILSSKICFCNATGSISWLALFPILSIFCSLSVEDLEILYNQSHGNPEELLVKKTHDESLTSSSSVEVADVGFRESFRNLRARIREAEPDRRAVRSIVESKHKFLDPLDLKTILRHARNCQATHPRDLVYAFLGLADPGYEIVAEYNNTIEEVLLNTATQIIAFENSLDVLSDAVGPRGQLAVNCPTWIPDWTSRETEHTPKISPDRTHEAKYSASWKAEACFAIVTIMDHSAAVQELMRRDRVEAAVSKEEISSSKDTGLSASAGMPAAARCSAAAQFQTPSAPPLLSPNPINLDRGKCGPPIVVANVSGSTTAEIAQSPSVKSSEGPSKDVGCAPTTVEGEAEHSPDGSSGKIVSLTEQISKEISKQLKQRFGQRQQIPQGQLGPGGFLQQPTPLSPRTVISPQRQVTHRSPQQPLNYPPRSQNAQFQQNPVPMQQMPASFQQRNISPIQLSILPSQNQQQYKPITYQQLPTTFRSSHPTKPPMFLPSLMHLVPPKPYINGGPLEPPSSSFLIVRATFIDTLRDVIHDSYGTSKDFRTSKGYSVHTTSLAQRMDGVFIIHGAKMPFVLRKQREHFILVSEAIIKCDGDSPGSILTDLFPGGLKETKNFMYITLI